MIWPKWASQQFFQEKKNEVGSKQLRLESKKRKKCRHVTPSYGFCYRRSRLKRQTNDQYGSNKLSSTPIPKASYGCNNSMHYWEDMWGCKYTVATVAATPPLPNRIECGEENSNMHRSENKLLVRCSGSTVRRVQRLRDRTVHTQARPHSYKIKSIPKKPFQFMRVIAVKEST